MTATYVALIAGGVTTRHAAVLTGVVRSTATRRGKAASAPTAAVAAAPEPEPVNKLTELERRRVLEVLTSDRFVDLFDPSALPQGWLPVIAGSLATGGRVIVAHADRPDLR